MNTFGDFKNNKIIRNNNIQMLRNITFGFYFLDGPKNLKLSY